MAGRANHRVTMALNPPTGTTPARGSYASAACPNGVNYCDSATAWASCCGDIGGSYTVAPQAVYQYALNAGFSGDEPYSVLYLVNRESSFVPDVIAHCPPCCCTEAGVDAVGLMQVVIQAWPRFTIEYLKDPQNNLYAAKYILDVQGWGAWTPLNAALDPSTIAYWKSIVGTGGSSTTEPGVSIANDIAAAPQPDNPPTIVTSGHAPSVNPPPDPIVVTLAHEPARFNDSTSGWESVTRYFTNDIPYYTGFDQYLIEVLDRLPGDAG